MGRPGGPGFPAELHSLCRLAPDGDPARVLLALVQTDLPTTLLVALGYLVVNTVIGSLLEPRIMGRGLGISTLAVFLSLLFWSWVLGTAGAFLAVPLTLALMMALDASPQTRPLAILLGSGVAPKAGPDTGEDS